MLQGTNGLGLTDMDVTVRLLQLKAGLEQEARDRDQAARHSDPDCERVPDRVEWAEFLSGGGLLDLHLLHARQPLLFYELAKVDVPVTAPEWMRKLASLALLIMNCARCGYSIEPLPLLDMFDLRPKSDRHGRRGKPGRFSGSGTRPYENFILVVRAELAACGGGRQTRKVRTAK